jgi:hypothetical protein
MFKNRRSSILQADSESTEEEYEIEDDKLLSPRCKAIQEICTSSDDEKSVDEQRKT